MWKENWQKNKDNHIVYRTDYNRQRLEWPDFINALPDILPDAVDLGIIGGLTLNGFTRKDIDWYFPIDDDYDYVQSFTLSLQELAKDLFNKPSEVGNIIAPLKPTPIPIQLYDKGVLRDRATLIALVVVRPKKIRNIINYIAAIEERLDAIESTLKEI